MAQDKAYRNAERKIEEAQRSGAKTLDLITPYGNSQPKLTELPESLAQLAQLQSLNLHNNQLTTLPEWLGDLTQLQSLDLRNNQLTALPESLAHLAQLQTLILNDNQLTAEWLGDLTQLQSLDLRNNQLTALPESLARLTQLQSLDLSRNQLTSLPEWLGELTQLQTLRLDNNQLTALPESLGHLRRLRQLDIYSNGITSLPESISRLQDLKILYMDNPFGHLPESIRLLVNLRELGIAKCGFSSLPEWIGELRELTWINLPGNSLTDLPQSIVQLKHLEKLSLADNPLNPELAAAVEQGLDAVKRYLREMAKGARKRYEAKLLILGDGNEGKTCVSRALRGLPFLEQKTTYGVDVEQWKFPHPDDAVNREKEITLNIWDFEGQEISHQTHQFFLTSQSLYLLVFKCRDQFLMDRAEYWLDTIRARAPKAKVAIVITQCEERSAYVPLDRLQAQYSDLLANEWFFSVECESGLNIDKLQTYLRRWAADLEFMGSPWPASYDKAEQEIKAEAERETAHIRRAELYAILAKAGASEDGYEDAANAMSRLGLITQFPDCPDLRDFVVLRPQWFTKAISKVMEDNQLSDDKGEIAFRRMEDIWTKAGYPGMFAVFHNCMKEFELCYDLEDTSQSCLAPLRFGYLKPTIPWTNGEALKERRVEYRLNIRPPMGLMSRFIVKTHHMIVKTQEHLKGIYWHNGVFLRTGEGPLCSEALCEFVPEDKKLRIEVRAAFPQNMCEQIHAYVKAVFSFFSGLQAERSYGCIKVDENTQAEQPCSGMHTEKRIYASIAKQRVLGCEFEDHDVDPMTLIWGLGSFSEFVMAKFVSLSQLRQELDRQPEWAAPYLDGVRTLLDWVSINDGKMDQLLQAQSALSAEFRQEAELKLNEYLARMSEMLDDRDRTAAPGLISIMAQDRSKWNPVGYFKKTYMLTPFCECEANIHACDDGKVEFTKDRAWWEGTAPWIARGTKLLTVGLQLAFAGLPLGLGVEAAKAIKNEVKFMQELTKHLELKAPEKSDAAEAFEAVQNDVRRDLRGGDREAALTRTALARFLEETAPDNYHARRWGSLRRVRMSDNSYRWLCEDCTKRTR